MGKQDAKRDYDKEVEELFHSVMEVSTLISGFSSQQEQGQMESKKAKFRIAGVKQAYILEIVDGQLRPTDDASNVTTYCFARSAEKFLEYFDAIFNGEVDAFERAIQRGDFEMKGMQSFHDRLMWKKALDRLAKARQEYSRPI